MPTIGPSTFVECPALPTDFVRSPALSTAELVFSADERYLAVHGDESSLHVWHFRDRQWVPIKDGYVRRVVWSNELEGFVALVDGSVRLYSCVDGKCQELPIATDVPEIGLEEWSELFITSDRLFVCTPRWVRTYNGQSGKLLSHADVPWSPGFEIHRTAAGARDGSSRITVLSFSVDQVRFEVIDPLGKRLSSFEVSKPAWRFAELYARAGVFAWLPIAEGRALQLTLGVSGDIELLTVSPYQASMLAFVAANSTVVALTSPNLMLVAGRGTSNSVDCDGTWYNAWPSDDGGVLAIPYSTGLPGAPDLTGVYDVINRRPLGHCRAHMCSAPHAVSPRNRYLASVIPDSIAQTHPTGLAAGTLVVTELPLHGC